MSIPRSHALRFRRSVIFFFQAEDGIRDLTVTGVQTCALPISTVFGSFGAEIYDAQKDFYVFRDFSTNVVKDRLTDSFCITGDDGCTHPGDQNAKYPRLNQNDQASDVVSSFFIESATYVRLCTLQVGWTIPPSLIRWLPSVRVYDQAENLFSIT